MEHLQKLDQVAYVRFASVYRQFKDIAQFMDEVKGLIKEGDKKVRRNPPGRPADKASPGPPGGAVLSGVAFSEMDRPCRDGADRAEPEGAPYFFFSSWPPSSSSCHPLPSPRVPRLVCSRL